MKDELELGFTFLMDYNEDRQVTLNRNISKTKLGLTKSVASSDQNQHAFVYLDTIGKIIMLKMISYKTSLPYFGVKLSCACLMLPIGDL